jgi:phosphate:Na+ symporter
MTLDLSKMGPLLLGLAAIPYLFSKRERTRNIAMALLGVGMLFMGLEMMSGGFKPLRSAPAVMAWFHKFQATTYLGVLKCALVGCLVTMVVQSSTATIGITIGLAQTGVIEFDSAIALVLGENIGTTITAFLASIGANRNARRAAYAHMLFNILGVFWVTLVFHLFYLRLVRGVTLGVADALRLAPQIAPTEPGGEFAQPRLGIAIAHSRFNIINTLLFVPFMGYFARVVTWMVPIRSSELKRAEEKYTPLFLDKLMLETPILAIEQSHKEIVAMGETNLRMLADLGPLMTTDQENAESEHRIGVDEDRMDDAQHAVVEFVSHLITNNVSQAFATEARRQLRRADEFESVSDYIRLAMKTRSRLRKSGETFSAEARSELTDLHGQITKFAEKVVTMVRDRRVEDVPAAKDLNAEILRLIKDIRNRHLSRLVEDKITAAKSVLYSDVLIAYRRMKDHLLNIVDTLVE